MYVVVYAILRWEVMMFKTENHTYFIHILWQLHDCFYMLFKWGT